MYQVLLENIMLNMILIAARSGSSTFTVEGSILAIARNVLHPIIFFDWTLRIRHATATGMISSDALNVPLRIEVVSAKRSAKRVPESSYLRVA